MLVFNFKTIKKLNFLHLCRKYNNYVYNENRKLEENSKLCVGLLMDQLLGLLVVVLLRVLTGQLDTAKSLPH